VTAARTAGVYLVLVGVALAGPVSDVWNASRLASRGFPGARVTRSVTAAQTERLSARNRLTRAEWLSLRRPGRAGCRTVGQRLGDQFMVDTAVHHGPAPTQQCNPAIAFDGNNYLVVWTAWDTAYYPFLLASRVTPNGSVLDDEPIPIDTGVYATVGFDGTNYLVVDGGLGYRISPAGEVLDSTRIVISTSGAWNQVLAFDGTNYLTVWEDYRDSVSQIYGARVTPDGTVLDTAGIAIATGQHALACPGITFDGTNFLVVWDQAIDSATSSIRGTRVGPGGQVLDSGFVIGSSSGANSWYRITATSDGTNSLVVWNDTALGLRGALVATDGSIVDTGIALTPAGYHPGHTSLYDGTNFLVAWAYSSSSAGYVMASRVSRAGVPLDTPGVYVSGPLPANTENPAVAFDGNRYFVTWDDDRYYCPNIYGARLTRQMSVLDTTGICISRSQGAANTQHDPSAAFDGNNYLVAWVDNRNMAGAVYAARVSPGGVNLDPAGIPVCTLASNRGYPSVAFDGTNYLVTWADGRRSDSADIYATRVTIDGSVLDPQGIPLVVGGDAHTFPMSAFNGTNYLLVWDDLTDSGMCSIRCARVSPAGQVLDPGDTLCTAWSAWTPVVAANGANWLVAWHDWRSEMNPGVYGARITSDGQVLDPGGFAIGAADAGEGCAGLASDGSNYLAVWERLDANMVDVRGARISTAGVLLDSFLVHPAVDSYATPPIVRFDGTSYGAVWVDTSWGSTWGISGAQISTEGEVIGVGRIASPLAWHTYYPMVSMAFGAGSQALCAYPCWTDECQGRTYNTERIWGRIGALAGIEEKSGTLVSGPNGGTIVRGVLFLPAATSTKLQAASLLDISGRKVLNLKTGANDVSGLAPGVFFIRQASSVRREASSIVKVVVAR
jgi:hypothetical protein